jgi:hypothetical protein
MHQKKHFVFFTSTKILMESRGKSLLLLISYETHENCVCVCVCVQTQSFITLSHVVHILTSVLYMAKPLHKNLNAWVIGQFADEKRYVVMRPFHPAPPQTQAAIVFRQATTESYADFHARPVH